MSFEGEEFYRSLIAQVKDYAIFTTDSRGVINTWNEGCKNVLGYDRDEFIGQHIKMLFPPEAVASGAADQEMKVAIEQGSASNDRWMMRKGEERLWCSGITTAVRDGGGNLIGFVKVMRDLTERKRLEERLRQSQLYLSLLIENLPQLVWTGRPDGECDYLSPQWVRYTGIPESEQLGFGWLNQLHPNDRQPTMTAWNRAVEEKSAFDVEYRVRAANGNYRWFKARALPLQTAEGEVFKWFGACTDIEDQKRVEALLRESEDRLRTERDFTNEIIDGMPGVFYICDRRGKFLRWNKNLEEITGRSGAEIASMALLELIAEEDWATVERRFEEVFAHGEANIEAQLLTKNGLGVPHFFTGRRAVIDGRPHLVCNGVDVTERRRGEEAAAYLAAIVESSDDAIISADLEGTIKSWNRGAERLYGYMAPEVIGRPMTMMIVPRDRESEESRILERIKKGERISHYETVRRRKDGTEVEVSLTVSPILGQGGDVIGISKTARDISERKRAEEALRESRERFRALVEATAQVVWAAAPNGEAVEDSPSWRAFTGQTYEQWRGWGWLDTVHPDDREGLAELWRQSVAEKSVVNVEYRIRHVSGEWRWTAVRAVPILNPDGSMHGWVGMNADVTERKRAEEERLLLLASERGARSEAEEANRSKDEFLATVSHELRSPLNAILGWARLLRDPGVRAGQLERALEIVERNAQAQARLIEDLLDVSRIVSGKLSLQMRPFILNSVTRGAVADLRPAAEARGVDLRLTEGEDLHLIGDADRLQQVVWNLLSNAIKFTPEGGQTEVELKRVGERAELRVRDTGRGISPEFLPHVFDRFQQFTRADASGRAGLGLGLAIVRHIVEAHGGSVTAESPGVGQGATFICKFPLTGVEQEVIPAVERRQEQLEVGAGRPLSGVRALVVDDDPDARDMLKATLNNYGAEVTTAAAAPQALDILASERIDVLVSDINMPGMDGYEFIRRVRAMKPEQGGRVPAVALTAYARPEDRLRALQSGYQIHVPKPVDPAELGAVVAMLIKGVKGRG
jgi:PAS domain S-box-containing protein